MSLLNPKNVEKKVMSYNGNPQSKKDSGLQLFQCIVNSMYGKDQYYESASDVVKTLRSNVTACVSNGNMQFVANTAVFGRTQMKMRTMPIVLTVMLIDEVRKQGKTFDDSRKLVSTVIQRADQATDLYSYALSVFGSKKNVPMSIKRGVADAMNKFDEYQFAKYDRKGAVSFRDLLRIVHPKAKNDVQGELFKKIMEERLETPNTWETQISNAGQVAKETGVEVNTVKGKAWSKLIDDNALGYMALLRNLRNIFSEDFKGSITDAQLDSLCARLRDPNEVARSKQLPFRFVTAMNMLFGHSHDYGMDAPKLRRANKLKNALSDALDTSVSNMPSIGEKVWIIVDTSGSMGQYGAQLNSYGRNKRGNVMSASTTACTFAGALAKANRDSDELAITAFATSAKTIIPNTNDSVLSISESIARTNTGYGTDLGAALKQRNKLGFTPDTVIVFSDMQVNQLQTRGGVNSVFDKDCMKIAFDLNQYESTPLSERQGWFQLSGWSERIFDMLPLMRENVSVVKYLGSCTISEILANK